MSGYPHFFKGALRKCPHFFLPTPHAQVRHAACSVHVPVYLPVQLPADFPLLPEGVDILSLTHATLYVHYKTVGCTLYSLPASLLAPLCPDGAIAPQYCSSRLHCLSNLPYFLSSHPIPSHPSHLLILEDVLELHNAGVGLQDAQARHLLPDILRFQMALYGGGRGRRVWQGGKMHVRVSGLGFRGTGQGLECRLQQAGCTGLPPPL